MTLSLSTEDLQKLARSLPMPNLDEEQKLQLIAEGLGYADVPELMKAAALNGSGMAPALVTDLADWRAADGVEDETIGQPIRAVVAREGNANIDIYLGGSDLDYSQVGASSIRVEREGDMTRFLIYDANCEAPRIFGVKDGEHLTELMNDWQPTGRPAPDDEPGC